MSRLKGIADVAFCAAAPAVSPDWSKCIAPAGPTIGVPPIDEFYSRHRDLRMIALGSGAQSDLQRQLLLLGYVSATELYFKRVHTVCMQMCSVTRAKAEEESIPFIALDYCDPRGLEAALTERASFTDVKVIGTFLMKYWGFNGDSNPALKAALLNYAPVCQMRHAIVHSGGHLSSRNVRHISPSGSGGAVVRLDAPQLDQAAGSCMDVVRTVNNAIGQAMLERWIRCERVTADWNEDRAAYSELLNCFWSRDDAVPRSRSKALGQIHASAKLAVTQLVKERAAGRRR
ncbi:hypothetical protein GCM10027039_05850 [Terrabacter koreensis]